MAESVELSYLYVEGVDDQHTLIHLLARHNIVLDEHLGPVKLQPKKGDKPLLESVRTEVRASANRAVGFVIDANGSVAQRWQSVCNCLNDLDLTLPPAPPRDGLVADSPRFKTRVGVWIMPDNETDEGRLEHLLDTLVPPGDKLMGHARRATAEAQEREAQFPKQDQLKAELHCWLAWQKVPGLPYGTALKAKFFRHDSDVAHRFVDWFRAVFPLPFSSEPS